MDNKGRGPVVPTYVIQAVLGGLLFLLTALVLGALILSGGVGKATGGENTGSGEKRTMTLDKEQLDNRFVVVMDAGHGGYDPGAVSTSGITENEVTEAVVAKVLQLLNRHPSEIRALISKEEDAYATPMARANVAVKEEADLLVSLHLNADTSAYTRGFQIFPAPPGRIHHEKSLELARLIVKNVSEQTEIPIMGDNGVYYHYYHETATGGYAKEVIDSVFVDDENPSEAESFGVLDHPGCPAVLVEMWHISSPQDMNLFYSEQGYDTMAYCIYQSICEYLGVPPKSKG